MVMNKTRLRSKVILILDCLLTLINSPFKGGTIMGTAPSGVGLPALARRAWEQAPDCFYLLREVCPFLACAATGSRGFQQKQFLVS